jgi:hypothetical protein
MPLRSIILCSIAIMPLEFPQERSIPSRSSGVSRPFSKHSMAKARVAPAEMVSMPAVQSSFM